MKALVIGASGQLGGALLRILERSAIEATGSHFSRSSNGTRRLDARDPESVRRCLAETGADVVFWAANLRGGVDACELRPAEAHALNVEGIRNVASAMRGSAARLVYYSTDYIFDGRAGPYSEEEAPSPINVYGRSKWEGEQAVRELVPEHLTVRTTAIFSWDRSSPNFAMQVWEHLQAGKPFRAPCDQWCNPTLADYLAEATIRLLQGGARGVFNVVGKDRTTRSELAKALARAMALDPAGIIPVATSQLGQKALRPLQGGLKTGKLEQFLQTEPLDLTESLKRFRRHWRADTHVAYRPAADTGPAGQLKQEILAKVREYYSLVHAPKEFKPYKTRVQYSGRVFGPEELVNLVDSSLDFWLTLGPYGDLFERKMRDFFGSRDFILVNSGSTANLCAVMTLMSRQLDDPLRAGDEVITPAVTFPTTVAPIVHSGLIPVFVDCEVGTYNVNPRLLEGAISERTRAILVPHTLGNPCDMDVICDLVKRYSLYLVEDTCDALGASFRGKLVGTFGDLATVSFFPAHHLTMGEGGGVIANSARLARVLRSVRDWGRDCWCAPGESNTCGKRFGWQLGDLPAGYDHKYIYSNIGYNFKPTDLQAAIGVAQADRIPQFLERRRENFARLYHGLQDFQDQLILPALDARTNPSWFGFPITVTGGLSRQELVQRLENAGIETRQIFAGNILKQPAYRNIVHRIHGTLEQTDRIMRDTFFIGVYPGLTQEMINFVLSSFQAFFARRQ